MQRYFFDTNVLVYSVDRSFPDKRATCQELIDRHARSGDGVLSTQVLQEFYVNATRKLGIEPLVAKQHVQDFQIFDVIQVTPDLIAEGIDCSILNRLSFWDGLVIAAAAIGRCTILYSEDMTNGQKIRGVTISNPFTKTP